MPERAWIDNVAVGVKQESAYGTPLAFTDMPYRLSYRGEKPAITSEYRSDRDYLGKGTAHTTTRREVRRDLRWSPEWFLSTLTAGKLLGEVLGSIAESGSGPYVSVFTEADAASAINAVPVSAYIEDGADKFRADGLAAAQAVFAWRQGEEATVQAQYVGSGRITAGAYPSLPAVSAPNAIIGGNVTVEIGPQGGSFTDFTADVFQGSVTVGQILADALGYTGTGVFRSRLWFQEHRHTFQLRLLKNGGTAIKDWAEAQTMLMARFTFTHSATEKIVLLFPGVKLLKPRTAVEQGFNAQDVTPGDDGIFVDGNGTPDEPVEATVTHPTDLGFLETAA